MSQGPESKSHTPFAVFNRTLNPLVRGLLSSPLHRPLSGRLALITVTGRKSGTVYTIPVLYKRSGDKVEIPIEWPDRKRWWRNLRGGAPIKLRLRGTEYLADAETREHAAGGVSVLATLTPPT